MSSTTRTFSHPVLRKDADDFTDGSQFQVIYTPKIEEVNNESVLKLDIQIDLDNASIAELIQNNQARVYLDIYSKDTLWRESLPLSIGFNEVRFQPGQLIGAVELQAYICTILDLEYVPVNLNSEYEVPAFSLIVGSLLALGEKNVLPLLFKRIRMDNLIRVQKSKEIDPDVYEFVLESHVITILMGERFYGAWDLTRSDAETKPYLYISVYKDAFIEALNLLRISETVSEYSWAQNLLSKCEDLGINHGDLRDFSSLNSAALRLLSEFGVKKLVNIHE